MDDQTPQSTQPRFDFSRQAVRRLAILGMGMVVVITLLIGGVLFLQNRSDGPQTVTIEPNARYAEDQMLVQFKEGIDPQNPELFQRLESLGVTRAERAFPDEESGAMTRYYLLHLKPGSDERRIHELLSDLDQVEKAQPNYEYQIFEVPNDGMYPQMWGLEKIQAPAAWDVGKGSDNIVVAVIDTGIDMDHADFNGRSFAPGYDMSQCAEREMVTDAQGNQQPGKCIRTKPRDSDPDDDHYHGTHVAGTIGAMTGNALGVAGVSWNVTLMGVKTQDRYGVGSTRDIIDGILYAARNGAHVINMSLGGLHKCNNDPAYQQAIDEARSNGAVVIVAAGNANMDASEFTPASCQGVVTVGATGPDDSRASYSNFGSIVDIAAPGGERTSDATKILSTIPDNKYRAVMGTSMASPHVAGVAALIRGVDPGMSPQDVERCLLSSADTISTDRPIGGKRVNAYRALTECGISPPTATPPGSQTGTPTATPTVTIAPSGYYVRGVAYVDTNMNRVKDSGEAGYSGATISISGPKSGTTTSGDDGGYVLSDLSTGEFQMTVSVGAQAITTYRLPFTDTVRSYTIDTPIPPSFVTPTTTPPGSSGSLTPTGTSGSTPSGGTITPTPTPVTIYDCKEVTRPAKDSRGRSISMKYLECSPVGTVQPRRS